MELPKLASAPSEVPAATDSLSGDSMVPSEGLPATSARGVPRFRELMLWTVTVGVCGGLVAIAYYYLLEGSFHLLWKVVPEALERVLPQAVQRHHWLWVVTAIGGALVGLSLKLFGKPGEISAVVNNIHMEGGRIDMKQTPSMVVVSLISIAFGGSAGPEAPLVQINGSFGSWLGEKLGLAPEIVRTLTFCGMGAALGAFFGAPLGGALFALEIPHRRGLEYYEALVPAVVSSILAFVVFRGFTGLSLGALYHFEGTFEPTLRLLFISAALGVLGAFCATLFVALFRVIEHAARPLEHSPVLLGAVGGACIGLIATFFPQTLFFGEHQGAELIESARSLSVLVLLGIALAKMLAVSCTLHSGFRGGFIFPLFFIGAAVGLAVSHVFPSVPPMVAALCTMAAINVAVTKTPISTSVILATLSGFSMVPTLVIASFVSFLLTTRVALIQTQRSRRAPGEQYRAA